MRTLAGMGETLRSSGKLSLAVAASRILGLVRELIFAHLFGVGAIADAYQVAFRIPNLLRDLFAEGALSSAFVPTFLAEMREGDEGAYRLANLSLAGVLMVTGTLSVLGMVFAEQIVSAFANGFRASGLSSAEAAEKLRIASSATRIMMPLLAVISVSAVWMGILNAQRRYLAPAWAPAMFNVASILVGTALVVIDPQDEIGIMVWAAGTLGAGLVQAGVQLPALWRLGYRPLPRLRGLATHPGIRRILRLMAPALIGLAAVQINIFVNTRFAASLGDGPIAQLSYAFRIFYLPVGVFTVALATITTTRVSEDAAKADMEGLRANTAEGASAVWMLMTASTVGLLVLAEPVLRVLFFSFSAAEIDATALVLRAYVLGLLPYGLVKIYAPVFYGLDRARIPLVGSFVAVVVNLGFNAATYRVLGAPGLALGLALGAMANGIVLRVAFARRVGSLPGWGWRRVAALWLANVVMGAVVFGAWAGVEAGLGVVGSGTSAWVRGAGRVLGLASVVSLGLFAYLGVLRALRYPGAQLLWALPAKALAKLSRGPGNSGP